MASLDTPLIVIEDTTNATSESTGAGSKGEESNSATSVIPCSISALLKTHGSALLVNSINSRTLLYHYNSLSGTWLGLFSVSNLILKADTTMEYQLWVAAKRILDECERKRCPNLFKKRYRDTLHQLLFEVGAESTSMINGPHVTYVDPRKHNDIQGMVDEARQRSQLFYGRGFTAENILVSIPATDAGLQAGKILQKEGINVNIYLVGSLIHAVACAETGAAAVTIHVRRVLEWFERERPNMEYHRDMEHHPGIETIQSIMAYFRLRSKKTRIIGTQFRKMSEIALLADFDAVCVSTYQLDRLEWNIARYAPQDNSGDSVSLRAKQTQYPAGLLCEDGNFMKRVSRDSRRMIRTILYPELDKFGRAMGIIETAVVNEVNRHLKMKNPTKKRSDSFSIARELRPARKTPLSTTSSFSQDGEKAAPLKPKGLLKPYAVDEVF